MPLFRSQVETKGGLVNPSAALGLQLMSATDSTGVTMNSRVINAMTGNGRASNSFVNPMHGFLIAVHSQTVQQFVSWDNGATFASLGSVGGPSATSAEAHIAVGVSSALVVTTNSNEVYYLTQLTDPGNGVRTASGTGAMLSVDPKTAAFLPATNTWVICGPDTSASNHLAIIRTTDSLTIPPTWTKSVLDATVTETTDNYFGLGVGFQGTVESLAMVANGSAYYWSTDGAISWIKRDLNALSGTTTVFRRVLYNSYHDAWIFIPSDFRSSTNQQMWIVDGSNLGTATLGNYTIRNLNTNYGIIPGSAVSLGPWIFLITTSTTGGQPGVAASPDLGQTWYRIMLNSFSDGAVVMPPVSLGTHAGRLYVVCTGDGESRTFVSNVLEEFGPYTEAL